MITSLKDSSEQEARKLCQIRVQCSVVTGAGLRGRLGADRILTVKEQEGRIENTKVSFGHGTQSPASATTRPRDNM